MNTDIKFSARAMVNRVEGVTAGYIAKRGEIFQMDTECTDGDRVQFEQAMKAEAVRQAKFCAGL